MVRKRKRVEDASDTTRKFRDKRIDLSQSHSKLTTSKEDLAQVVEEMKLCRGAKDILRFKTLRHKKDEIKKRICRFEEQTEEKTMHKMMSEIDRLEEVDSSYIKERPKCMQTDNRLYPPVINKKNIFDVMRPGEEKKWKSLRAHKKRYSVMFNTSSVVTRTNHIDTCSKCCVDRIVDKESARSICPRCGNSRMFASHIFDTKEVEKNEGFATRQQSLSHMQKFSAQFERGYPPAPISVLEKLFIQYSKFHFHDPSKVQSCRTTQLMKKCTEIPKMFRRAPDRLTKELRGESIPEYTPQEINNLLNQRNRLRMPEEMKGDISKHKKSFNNQIYMRQFGRANNMEVSRLFPHAKTNKIHIERCRGLERECIIQQNRTERLPDICEEEKAKYLYYNPEDATTVHEDSGRESWLLRPFS
jgi:hypothetical protein